MRGSIFDGAAFFGAAAAVLGAAVAVLDVVGVLDVLGALSGVEMGLALCGLPHRRGGIAAALDLLAATSGTRGDA